MSRLRGLLLALVDRSEVSRSVLAAVLVRVYGRRGADDAVLAEARRGARARESKRTAEMVQWAGAINGVADFPTWFPAAHHLRDDAARRRSARALGAHLAANTGAPSRLWRQYFLLDEPTDLDGVRQFVRHDLAAQLDASATATPPDRTSMSSDGQLEILRRATAALESVGLRPFLVSGSLLGLVRDGCLMEHDYDIDLGILPGDGDTDVVAGALRSAGFDVTVQALKVVARDASGFAVDVFVHYERDGLVWHGTEIHEWWNTPFRLVRDRLGDVAVWVPDDTDRYLEENYGAWQRPIAFYDFSFDTPNRRYRRTPQALLYLHKRLTRALEERDRWAAESAARELRDQFGVDVTDAMQTTHLLDPAWRREFV